LEPLVSEANIMALTEEVINCLEERAPNVWPTIRDADDISYEFVASEQSPTLMVEGLHLTSSYDRRFESFHRAQRVEPEHTRATVYGFGLGDVVRALLKREDMERIDVVVLNPRIARLSLTLFDHTDWLMDERVALQLGEAHATPSEPFAVSPACLKLASDDNRELAERIRADLQEPLPESIELVDSLELAALSFIHGVDGQASEYLIQFIDMLTEALSTGQTEETIKGFLEILDITVKAQARKDYLLVADMLLYEFRPAVAE
jgi:hypothetical protein